MVTLALKIQTPGKSKGSLSPSDDQKPGGTVRRVQFSLVDMPLAWASVLFQTVLKLSREQRCLAWPWSFLLVECVH